MEKEQRISELEGLIACYQASYYAAEGEISDAQFDALWDELKLLDPQNPILQKVGGEGASSGFKKARHIMPMGSQEKAANPDEFAAWAKKQAGGKFLVEYKLDGASLELQYEKGRFVRAVTRGDGEAGDDITRNAVKMRGIVFALGEPLTGAVRGEVIMNHDVREKHFSDKANCRNAANGLMKRKEGDGVEMLRVICYDAFFGEKSPFGDEIEKIEWIEKKGFDTAPRVVLENVEEICAYREKVAAERKSLEYDIDGLVVKSIPLDLADLARARPEKQVAFKFSLERAATTLRRIIWSESGATYTPIAEFDPVELAGTTVQHASLCNPNTMAQLGVKIGSTVVVVKRGEIIPKIEEATFAPENAAEIEIPATCETCGAALQNDGTRLFCPNRLCEKRILHRIEKWISTVGILEFGENLVRRLFDAKKLCSVSDIYALAASDIAEMERMAEKSAANVIKSRDERRKVRLSQLIAGFDIEGIGEVQAEKLVAAGFDSLEKMLSAGKDEFAAVFGFAEISAQILAEGLAENADEMRSLVASGAIEIESAEGALSGKSFCFTGELSMKRDEAAALVRAAGGTVKSSVTKGLSFLVTNDTASGSAKNKKAASLGVPILDEKAFLRLVKGGAL